MIIHFTPPINTMNTITGEYYNSEFPDTKYELIEIDGRKTFQLILSDNELYNARIDAIEKRIAERDTPVSDEYKKGYDAGYELGFSNGYVSGERNDYEPDYYDTEEDQYSEWENHCTECGLHNDKCEC